MIPRRHFLAFVATPVALATLSDRVAARHVDHTALPHALQDRMVPADPLIARMRAIDIDETVEPALVFLPRG